MTQESEPPQVSRKALGHQCASAPSVNHDEASNAGGRKGASLQRQVSAAGSGFELAALARNPAAIHLRESAGSITFIPLGCPSCRATWQVRQAIHLPYQMVIRRC
jgi:hypothetical protein